MQYKNLKEEVVEVSVYDCYVYKCNYFTKEVDVDCLMLKSIGTYGVINPVIARYKNHKYEIILGRRRFLALKELGIPIVPLIIRDLNDTEVDLLIIEANVNQRGVETFKHSELANIVYTYYSNIKAQGRRTDLLNEVRNLLDIMGNDDEVTFRPVGEKLDSTKECSNKFKISTRTVSRYLRVYLLIDELKQSLDENLISLRASVELSYIECSLQKYIASLIQKKNIRITYEQAVWLRHQQKQGKILDRLQLVGQII